MVLQSRSPSIWIKLRLLLMVLSPRSTDGHTKVSRHPLRALDPQGPLLPDSAWVHRGGFNTLRYGPLG